MGGWQRPLSNTESKKCAIKRSNIEEVSKWKILRDQIKKTLKELDHQIEDLAFIIRQFGKKSPRNELRYLSTNKK